MKAYIGIKERYPDFQLEAKSAENNEVEVSASTLDRWKKVIAAYEGVQTEIKKLVDPQPLDPNDPANTTIDTRGK